MGEKQRGLAATICFFLCTAATLAGCAFTYADTDEDRRIVALAER